MLSVSIRPKRALDATFVTLLLDETCSQWGADATSGEIERCVFVTRGDSAELLTATRLGIQVFVGFEDEPEVLRDAVQAAMQGESYCSRTLLPRLLKALREGPVANTASTEARTSAATLSEREREIAGLVASGGSNEQVAERLFVSVATVKFHLGNVYRKLGISRRGQLFSALPGLTTPADRSPGWARPSAAYATDALVTRGAAGSGLL